VPDDPGVSLLPVPEVTPTDSSVVPDEHGSSDYNIC
jgi:hypothetical protein